MSESQPHPASPAANAAPAPEDDPLAFTPVPTDRARHDGWTPDRQRRFIEALALMGVVARAAKAVGMSGQSAYMLRRRAGAEGFATAWDTALEMGRDRAFEIAVRRATIGIEVPYYYRGRLVGVRHRFDYRLALAAIEPPRTPPPKPPRQGAVDFSRYR